MADLIALRQSESNISAGSAHTIVASFRDRATGTASVPSSIIYRVDCLTTGHNVVNDTSASAASSATLVIPGPSNAIINRDNEYEVRQLTVEIDTGLSTQVRQAVTWRVRNILNFVPVFEFEEIEDPRLEPRFPITEAEISAGVTPTHYGYEPGDVRRYGMNATPGTTDMSAALQAAIDQYAEGGAEVVLPDEAVLISQRLEITSASGLSMRGSGYKSVVTCAAASTFIFLLFQRSDFGAINGVRLRDFRIDANGSGQLDAGVIQLNGCVGFVVDGVWIENASRASGTSGVNGISLSSGSFGVGENPTGVIRNCYLTGCSKSPINCSTGTDGVLVEGNICHSNTGNGTTPGIQIFGGLNCKVKDNWCYNNEGPGIFIATNAFDEGPDYCLVEGNHCYDNGQGTADGEGISVQNAQAVVSGRVLIRGNHCYRNGVNVAGGSAGIFVQEQSHVIVDGNYCYANRGPGISVDQASNTVDNVSLINNTLEENNRAAATNGAGINILAGAYTKLVIRGNKYFDNQGTPTQKWAVRFDTSGSVTDLTIHDDQAKGHTNVQNYSMDGGMTFSRIDILISWDRATTDATNTNGPTFTLADNTAVFLVSTVVAMETDGSDRAAYRVSALVYRDGGGATVQGAVSADQTIESDAAWDSTIIVGSNQVAPRVTGAAATNINWRGKLEVLSVA